MKPEGCIFWLVVMFVAILYFGFFYEPSDLSFGGEPEETWKTWTVVDYSLEQGWHATGKYSESSFGRWRLRYWGDDED